MERESMLLFPDSGNSVSTQCLFTCYSLWQAVSPKSRVTVLAPYTSPPLPLPCSHAYTHAKGEGAELAEEEGGLCLPIHIGVLFTCCFALFLFI
jgi:hypothetical protein